MASGRAAGSFEEQPGSLHDLLEGLEDRKLVGRRAAHRDAPAALSMEDGMIPHVLIKCERLGPLLLCAPVRITAGLFDIEAGKVLRVLDVFLDFRSAQTIGALISRPDEIAWKEKFPDAEKVWTSWTAGSAGICRWYEQQEIAGTWVENWEDLANLQFLLEASGQAAPWKNVNMLHSIFNVAMALGLAMDRGPGEGPDWVERRSKALRASLLFLRNSGTTKERTLGERMDLLIKLQERILEDANRPVQTVPKDLIELARSAELAGLFGNSMS